MKNKEEIEISIEKKALKRIKKRQKYPLRRKKNVADRKIIQKRIKRKVAEPKVRGTRSGKAVTAASL